MSDKITTRLRKLIRLGESPDEHEAANALQAAAKLAAKYHLDLAAIETEDEGSALGQRKSDVVLWGRRKRKYRWQLAHVVARAWGCAPWTASVQIVTFSRPPTEHEVLDAFGLYFDVSEQLDRPATREIKGNQLIITNIFGGVPHDDCGWKFPDGLFVKAQTVSRLVMFGRRDAAEAAIYSYHVLVQAVDSIAKRVASGRSSINDARWGLVFGLGERLSDMLDDDDADEDFEPDIDSPKSTALVLTEARDEAERYLADCFGESSAYVNGPEHQIKDQVSFSAGLHAAEEIDIPDPSGGRTALGGSHALPVGEDRQLA